MKKIVIITTFLTFMISCKAQQELYILLDTRDTVHMKYSINPNNNEKFIGKYTAKYFIYKDDPGKWYGGGVLLKYWPYKDSILRKWKNTKKLRTKNISISEWKKLKKKSNTRVVDGFYWIHSTPWDTIYKELHQYYFYGNMYVVDKKFITKDSIQVRGVDYEDNRAQVCYDE